MTDAEIDALEEVAVAAYCVELDRLVALQCGFTLVYDNGYDGEFKAEIWPEEPRVFRPSSDWNDAMLAAEKVDWQRKNEGDRLEVSYQPNGSWNAMIIRYADDYTVPSEMQLGINHKCGPVAICRAILKAVKK